MSILEKLFGGQDPSFSESELLEAGACPNCWGEQEYDGLFIQFVKDPTKSNINHDKANKKAFVQQFIETEITGIRLKREGDLLVCPSCVGKYKHVSSNAS